MTDPAARDSLLLTASQLRVDAWTELEPPAVLVDVSTGRITATGEEAIARADDSTPHRDFPNGVLCPALIDCHVHVVFTGDGSPGETTMQESHEALVNRGVEQAQQALGAGVTTIVDQGGPPSVTFAVRAEVNAQRESHASVRAAGAPITTTREHMWYFGGEASATTSIASVAEQQLRDGADFLKIVATGGGTAGSREYDATFEADEIADAVAVARREHKITAAHASSSEGIRRALEGGCHVIHHCNFYDPDGVRRFNPRLAERLSERNVFVDPTLWVTESLIQKLHDGRRDERSDLDRTQARWESKLVDVAGLIAAGVKLVVGSDAGWQYAKFGDTWREAHALAAAGLPSRDAYAAATAYAADALRISSDVGRLSAHRFADVLVLQGDPVRDLRNLASPIAVFHRGREAQLRSTTA